MAIRPVEIIVYGANERCPSCVNLPSSEETFEWLQAALSRKFPNQVFKLRFVNIHETETTNENDKKFAHEVVEEDLFYPVVVLNGEIVAEGNPRLKVIYEKMEKYGYVAGM
jgi:disulfide oxidoreductase YuzD